MPQGTVQFLPSNWSRRIRGTRGLREGLIMAYLSRRYRNSLSNKNGIEKYSSLLVLPQAGKPASIHSFLISTGYEAFAHRCHNNQSLIILSVLPLQLI